MAFKPEELQAANTHLAGTGMARYGWLPHQLRVALHKAAIPTQRLKELGNHFLTIGDAKALTDVMKTTATKLATSPQAAFDHLLGETAKKARAIPTAKAAPVVPARPAASPTQTTEKRATTRPVGEKIEIDPSKPAHVPATGDGRPFYTPHKSHLPRLKFKYEYDVAEKDRQTLAHHLPPMLLKELITAYETGKLDYKSEAFRSPLGALQLSGLSWSYSPKERRWYAYTSFRQLADNISSYYDYFQRRIKQPADIWKQIYAKRCQRANKLGSANEKLGYLLGAVEFGAEHIDAEFYHALAKAQDKYLGKTGHLTPDELLKKIEELGAKVELGEQDAIIYPRGKAKTQEEQNLAATRLKLALIELLDPDHFRTYDGAHVGFFRSWPAVVLSSNTKEGDEFISQLRKKK